MEPARGLKRGKLSSLEELFRKTDEESTERNIEKFEGGDMNIVKRVALLREFAVDVRRATDARNWDAIDDAFRKLGKSSSIDLQKISRPGNP